MKKMIFTIIICIVTCSTYSQTVKCNDLHDFIVEKGYRKATLASYILSSSWLSKVTAYTYDYKTYVIAEIRREGSYTTNTYIFCGIPSLNWTGFQYGGYGDSDSYGERFHKYIMDYKCNCN